jgi:hypothetical protein
MNLRDVSAGIYPDHITNSNNIRRIQFDIRNALIRDLGQVWPWVSTAPLSASDSMSIK